MDIYRIQWRDSYVTDIGWHSKGELLDEFENDLIIDSIGFVLDENDKYIALVQNTYTDQERMSNMICIPKDCIVKKDLING